MFQGLLDEAYAVLVSGNLEMILVSGKKCIKASGSYSMLKCLI